MINEIDLYYWGKEGYEKGFISSNIYLCFLFRILLGKYDIRKIKKIVVRLIDPSIRSINNIEIKRNVINELGDIVELWQDFSMKDFLTAPQEEQRIRIWTILKDCIRLVAESQDVDYEPVQRAFDEGVARNLKCIHTLDIVTYNKLLNIWGTIRLKCNEDNFTFYVVILDLFHKEVQEKKLVQFLPQEGLIKAYLVKGAKWKKNEFFLTFTDKESYSIVVDFQGPA